MMWVRRAAHDLAAWSGVPMICTQEVLVAERVYIRDDGVDVEVSGASSKNIEISLQSDDLYRITTHELCHAIDDVAGYSRIYTGLFSGIGVELGTLYDTDELRRAELFAEACEGGPRDLSLQWEVAARCGTTPDPVDVFINTTVYPFASKVNLGADFSYTATTRTLRGIDGVVRAMASAGGDLWVIEQQMVPGPILQSTDFLVRIDGERLIARERYALGRDTYSDALIPMDQAILLPLWDENGHRWSRFDLIERTFSPIDLPNMNWIYFASGVATQGVIYSAGTYWVEEVNEYVGRAYSTVRGWSLSDGEIPLNFDRHTWDKSVYPDAMQIVDGALELYSSEGLSRQVGDDWDIRAVPYGLYYEAFFPIDEHRRLLFLFSEQYQDVLPVVYDRAADTWSLPHDACTFIPLDGWYIVEHEGRVLVMSESTNSEEPVITVTEIPLDQISE